MNPLQLAIIEKIGNYNDFKHVLVFKNFIWLNLVIFWVIRSMAIAVV